MVNREKIAYFKGTKSTDPNKKVGDGILIIDPNMVNDNGVLKNRLVKQEDLMIYSSLIVYKNHETSVIETEGKKGLEIENREMIKINFLNPIKESNGERVNKGKLTTEWADFFTSNQVNNELLDPESFGISNITISINASNIPITEIEFIDVQGRTLFERGNDPNNPYNIFFTFPYPKFLLSYKGYYGTTVEVPLVLVKTDTRYDPQTGNYTTTANFISEIFALFNSLLIIYAYAAPFMFRLSDSDTDGDEYLGKKILRTLYEKQNKEIANSTDNIKTKQDYLIYNAPTLYDLSRAVEELPKLVNTNTTSDDKNAEVLRLKYAAQNHMISVKRYITDNYKLNGNVYIPKDASYIITDKTPNALIEKFKTINTIINSLDSDSLFDFKTKLLPSLENINRGLDKINYASYTQRFNSGDFINYELFKVNNDEKKYSLIFFDEFEARLLELLNNMQQKAEIAYIENSLLAYNSILGWTPNLSNVLRIIANNVQTFITLLELTSVAAQNQILTDSSNRKNVTKQKIEYNTSITGNKVFNPFPSYYKNITDQFNNEKVEIVYPGYKSDNLYWSEVQFVEELYNAITVLQKKSGTKLPTTFAPQNTSLLTVLGLDNNKLNSYLSTNNNSENLLTEAILKVNLFLPYSGFSQRGLAISDYEIIGDAFSKLEIDLMEKNVFENLDAIGKFNLATDVRNTIIGSDDVAGVNAFSNKIGPSIDYDNKILPNIQQEIKLRKSNISEAEYITRIDSINKTKNQHIINTTDSVFYGKIWFKESPLLFTLDSSSFYDNVPVKINLDISRNRNYISDNSDLLSDLRGVIGGASSSKYNDNTTQGFIKQLNYKLRNIGINTDFSTSIDMTYEKTQKSQHALTFSRNLVTELGLQNPAKRYSYLYKQISLK